MCRLVMHGSPRCLTHHPVGSAGIKEVVVKVKEGEEAANSPHIDSMTVGKAEEDFRGPEEGR